jgi:hypothetical protein
MYKLYKYLVLIKKITFWWNRFLDHGGLFDVVIRLGHRVFLYVFYVELF